jgi:hypothetical protein
VLELDEIRAALAPHVASGHVWFPASQSYSLQIPEGPIGVWRRVPALPVFTVQAEDDDYIELSLSFDWAAGNSSTFNMAVATVDTVGASCISCIRLMPNRCRTRTPA